MRKHGAVWKELAALLAAACLTLSIQYWLGQAMMPERYDYGAVWSTYLQEEKNSVDVLCFGASFAYCDIIPAVLYEESGCTAYVMAAPRQTVPVTYYYLKEACRTQSPKCVFVEVTGTFFERTTEYSRVNVDYMPMSLNKLGAALQCESGILSGALFPVATYHSVAKNMSWLEHNEQGAQTAAMLCGYTPLYEARPQQEQVDWELSTVPGDDVYQNNVRYLRKIKAFCEERGIALYFYFSPTMTSIPEAHRQQLFSEFPDMEGHLLDWTNLWEPLGIDSETQWYDVRHFNASGAEVFSHYLGEFLKEEAQISGSGAASELWRRRTEYEEQSIRTAEIKKVVDN